MSLNKDYLQLHFIVILASLIPSVVILISIPPLEIVFIRTLMAMGILVIYTLLRKINIKVTFKEFGELLLTGIFTSIYWVLLIISAKEANASVCLIGIATAPLWVSFINPFFYNTQVDKFEIITALNAVFGMFMIFNSGFKYEYELVISVVAGFFAAIVTVLNGKITRKHHHITATFYQMMGAWLGTIIIAPIYLKFYSQENIMLTPTLVDILLIIVLAVAFSFYMYSVMIKVMRTISPFIVALTNNLAPIYGIIAALLISGEQEQMTIYFYSGAVIIIASVFVNPLAKYLYTNSERV